MSAPPAESDNPESSCEQRAPIGARRIAWWAAGAVIALTAIVGAYVQSGRADPLATAPSVSELRWWLEPFQRNGFLRIPSVTGTVDALCATPDGRNIFALVSGQAIARSVDGGRTWETTKLNNQPQDNLRAMFFLDARRGWIAGHGVLFKTTDGGRTWTHGAFDVPSEFKTIQFVDESHAWALSHSGGRLWVTADGGVKWRLLEDIPGTSVKLIGGRELAVIKRVGQNGWVMRADGAVFATTTAGNQWQELPPLRRPTVASDPTSALKSRSGVTTSNSPTQQQAPQLATDPSSKVGSGGDSGSFTIEEDIEPHAIEAKPDGSIVVWFDDASSRRFARGATEWVVDQPPLLNSGIASQVVPLVDGALVRIAGGTCGVFRQDRARSRTTLVLGETDLFSAADIDVSSAAGSWWLSGGFGVLLRSDNQGRTWQPHPSPALSTLTVEFLDAQRGWVSSVDGTVYRTNDGGGAWRGSRKVGDFPLVALRFTDEKAGLALDQRGFLHESQDGGATWSSLPGVVQLARPQILTADANNVIRTADDQGKAYRLSSKRDSWELEPMALPKTEWWYRYFRTFRGGEVIAQSYRGPVVARSAETEPFIPRNPQEFLFTNFQSDGRIGVGVTPERALLRTMDGGRSWQTAPLPALVIPAPWYWLTWLPVVFCFWRARQLDPSLENVEESIAARAIADAPIGRFDHDALGLGDVARGLSRFFRNRDTTGPFTVAVSGAWGSGKTSFMRLLRDDLVLHGVRPVWFNAWHQQHETHYLPVLLEGIVSQAVPPAWLPSGWGFRGRLWLGRIVANWRQVFALLLLMTFSYALLTRPDAQQFLDDATKRAGEIWTNLSALVSGAEKPAPPTSTESSTVTSKTPTTADARNVGWTIVASSLAGSLLALLRIFYSAFSAFGVNPADLLSRATSTRNKDVEARMSFQRRFARDFSEVTAALGAVPLVIFIDDLDRCKPEKTVEMLEAVNFLVASGSCFVVMGLATDQVEASVGLGYSEIAAELAARSPDASAADERRQFARSYLEKLVNLSIPIPAPTNEQVAELLAGREEQKQTAAADKGKFWRWVDEFVRTKLPVVTQRTFEITLCLGLFVGAWQGGRRIAASDTVEDRAPKTPQTALADGARASRPGGDADAGARKTDDARKSDGGAAPTAAMPAPTLITHGTADTGSLGLLGIAIAAIAGSLAGLMMQRGRDVTRDSPHFITALRYWSPVIERSHATPRGLKRFINGVRYLAMQQTPEVMRTSLLERGVAWGARRFGGQQLPTRTRGDTDAKLEEDILVALAAIDAFARAAKQDAFTANGVNGVYDSARQVLAASKRRELTEEYPHARLNAHVEDYRRLTARGRRPADDGRRGAE